MRSELSVGCWGLLSTERLGCISQKLVWLKGDAIFCAIFVLFLCYFGVVGHTKNVCLCVDYHPTTPPLPPRLIPQGGKKIQKMGSIDPALGLLLQMQSRVVNMDSKLGVACTRADSEAGTTGNSSRHFSPTQSYNAGFQRETWGGAARCHYQHHQHHSPKGHPRQGSATPHTKPCPHEAAFHTFCRKVRKEITPTDLLLSPLSTVRTLLKIHKIDPITATRIELYWQQQNQTLPPPPTPPSPPREVTPPASVELQYDEEETEKEEETAYSTSGPPHGTASSANMPPVYTPKLRKTTLNCVENKRRGGANGSPTPTLTPTSASSMLSGSSPRGGGGGGGGGTIEYYPDRRSAKRSITPTTTTDRIRSKGMVSSASAQSVSAVSSPTGRRVVSLSPPRAETPKGLGKVREATLAATADPNSMTPQERVRSSSRGGGPRDRDSGIFSGGVVSPSPQSRRASPGLGMEGAMRHNAARQIDCEEGLKVMAVQMKKHARPQPYLDTTVEPAFRSGVRQGSTHNAETPANAPKGVVDGPPWTDSSFLGRGHHLHRAPPRAASPDVSSRKKMLNNTAQSSHLQGNGVVSF